MDEDSFVQTIFQPPTALEDNEGQRKVHPCSLKCLHLSPFEVHTGAAPKYLHTAKVKYGNQEYGPTALQSSGFGAQGTEGNNYWYYHQSSEDLDSPLPVPLPKAEGTIFLHRNLTDHQYQLWMWVNKDGALGWQPLDLATQQVYHPRVPQRALKLSRGELSWVLLTTLGTYAAHE
ncbi:hypothetical protein GYMLUDRAFT_64753 [Collybiopsis luxurians FD-317 M1]|uniref:Unplaced genomic scaffold GYMLUscaffold_112, whole genome shotgun sequence n=1 Tax=Collybiopsis luxurians FD-317 M1 TaxID=944289 RepID=A0A0D0BB72_9AGAR|nr:hypothetical protein GYMLUDRAFT_64753 [Collybiopsis luxurians FD-317 M1]